MFCFILAIEFTGFNGFGIVFFALFFKGFCEVMVKSEALSFFALLILF